MRREKQAETLLKSKLDVKTFNIPPYATLNEGKKRVKFFDSEGVFCISPLEDVYGIVSGVHKNESGEFLASIYYPELIGDNNICLFQKAVKEMNAGDTYEDFIRVCENTRYNVHGRWEWLERFIARISAPTIERVPGNKNTKTFDFIRVDVFLNDLQTDTLQEVKNHYNEIMGMVLSRIEQSHTFKRYGVSVNCLKVAKATLTRQKVLEIVFELKEPATCSKETK